jgi:hypothetical protein
MRAPRASLKMGLGKDHEDETPRVEAKKLALVKMGA